LDYVFQPADAPAAEGRQYIYKITPRARSASFVLALPREYQFNTDVYAYLKIGVYAPAKSSFASGYGDFQRIWPRFMNSMWAFGQNTDFGQEYWAPDAITIPDDKLQKWTDITVDLSQAVGKHNRVIVINIGGEPNFTYDPPADIIYYFSNIRLTKTQ